MSWLEDGLSTAIDAALFVEDVDESPLVTWSRKVDGIKASSARDTPSLRTLGHLQFAAVNAVQVVAGYEGGELQVLREWMEAREGAETMGPIEDIRQRHVLDALYDVAAVLESAEDDPTSPYLGRLTDAQTNTIEKWPRHFQWFLSQNLDVEEALDALDAAYDTRDTLEWALNCLTYFKLEFPGRLVDFDVDHYRKMLVEPDARFREVVKKAKREGWHQPDPDAPKSFWWRQK